MTLTQRLTRAGATFIVFGVVAAVLPQQNGAAQAVTGLGICNGEPVHYRLTRSTAANTDNDPSGATVAVKAPVTLYAYRSADGTNYSDTTGSYTDTTAPASSAMLSPASGHSTTFTANSSGSYVVTGTFTQYGATNIVIYPITVN